jgi:hypothetical protein
MADQMDENTDPSHYQRGRSVPDTELLSLAARNVHHPPHYGGDTVYEVIKVIEAWKLGFHLGNAVKYIARAGKKDKAKVIEDLRKAIWYIERFITILEKS